MQMKHIAIIALLVMTAVVISGCSGTVTPTPTPTPVPASQYPMTVYDYYNETATIASEPQRIVSLSAANTETLFALGLGSKIVGIDDNSDYPAETKDVVHLGGFATLNYEKIVSLNPDLIVVQDIVGGKTAPRLREMGFQVIEVKNTNMTMVRKNIELLGKATNTVQNATTLIADMDRKIAEVSAKMAGLNESQKPTVLLLTGFVASKSQIYPYGNGTYGDELLTLTGGKNAASDVIMYAVISNEAIVKADPDYIVIPVDGKMCTESDYNYFKNGSAPWMKDLRAVKNGKVVRVDGTLFLRAGPRLPDAGLALARAIHPEMFQ